MVRRNDEPTGPWNYANDSIVKKEPSNDPRTNPQYSIED
jgi:hypothetical protein